MGRRRDLNPHGFPTTLSHLFLDCLVELFPVTDDSSLCWNRLSVEYEDHECLVGHPLSLAPNAVFRGPPEPEARVILMMTEHDHERASCNPYPSQSFLNEPGADSLLLE